MKEIFIICITLITVGLNSCQQCNIKQPGADEALSNVTVVLCDLTKSVDTTAIVRIAKHAIELHANATENSVLYYYGIGPNDFNEYIGKYDCKIPLRENGEQQKKRLSKVAKEDSMLFNKITTLYHAQAYKKTCITHALKTAYDVLKCKAGVSANTKLNIVVLSDMLEDCDHYQLGKLKMIRKSEVAQTLKVLEKAPATDINLERANINLYMVWESQGDAITARYAHDAVSRHEIETVWNAILPKYGYTPNSQLVKYSWQSIPGELLAANTNN